MPDISDFETEADWMESCVGTAVGEGRSQEQAVAMCLEMWRGKGAALEMPMLMTKAEKLADGRIRWQARANCGKVDLEGERFDTSFWGDVTHNFNRAQEAISRSEPTPDGLPVPILDIAHYSFRLPPEKRNLARAGYPIKLWVDGTALMAQGYFDDTPLGRAAAKAATTRPVSERRISIGVWPDWGRVELSADGHRIYKGGRNRAYLDHLAITACPVDPGTVLEVKSMTQKQDAIDVLGEDATALVDELEAATTKAMPDGVVVKAEETEPEPQPEPQPEAKAEAPAEAAPESFTRGDMEKFLKQFVRDFLASFKAALDERMGPVEAAVGEIATMKAQIDALKAEETVKVQKAIDSGGNWWEAMMKASVQRREATVEGKAPAGPAEKPPAPDDPFNRMFGGLRKE